MGEEIISYSFLYRIFTKHREESIYGIEGI